MEFPLVANAGSAEVDGIQTPLSTMNSFNYSALWALVINFGLLTAPALAGSRYVSKNGFATVIFSSLPCNTKRPTASYIFRNGTRGMLTSLDCSAEGGDVFTHRFHDTEGLQRCQGVMTMVFGAKVVTSWKALGACRT